MAEWCLDTCRRNLLDRVLIDVNNVNVRHTYHLVEILLQRRSLCAPWVGWLLRGEQGLLLRVWYTLQYSLAPEIVSLIVRLLVKEHVLVGSKPELEATFVDQKLVVELFAVLRAIFEGILLQKVIVETSEGFVCLGERCFVLAIRFVLLFLLFVQGSLVHWETVVGSALVDRHLLGLRTNLLDTLDSRCTGTDLRDTFVLQIDTVLWPDCGVVQVASEVTQTSDRWGVAPRRETDRWIRCVSLANDVANKEPSDG